MIHRKNLEIIMLTEQLAVNRYSEVRFGGDEHSEFGEMSMSVASILLPFSGLTYNDAAFDTIVEITPN